MLHCVDSVLSLMRYKRCHKLLILCIVVNIVVFLCLFLSQHLGALQSNGVRRNALKSAKNLITVVIYDFENFEHDLPDTVQSLLTGLPDAKILIVSKNNPYPPLGVTPHENVKVIVMDQPASNPARLGNPISFIQSQYVLLVPDAVRMIQTAKLGTLDRIITMYSVYSDAILAFPSDDDFQCADLTVDLRLWTLTYKTKNERGSNTCDAIIGGSRTGLLMLTSQFTNLTEPFIRPSLESLFIQFTLRRWKTSISQDELFGMGKQLFRTDHNRWKAEQKKKERLIAMYKRFGIKLVQKDGQDQLYGCNKKSARCFGTVVDDMPEYIYNDRWTPPCCMRNLRETTKYVFRTLMDHDVKYWLEGGSLLGAVRHRDIIPWDYDVDIGIYQNEIEKCPQLKRVLESTEQRFIDDNGFVWEKAREGEFYRVQFSEVNHLHVDIFPFYERDGVMTKDTWFKTHRQDAEFPAHYLKPLTTIDFIGIKASVPNNYREFLELKFGKGVVENPQFPNPKKIKKKPKDVGS